MFRPILVLTFSTVLLRLAQKAASTRSIQIADMHSIHINAVFVIQMSVIHMETILFYINVKLN